MLTPKRPNGRRRWLLVAVGLGLAGLIVVTAMVAFSSDDSSANPAPATAPARSPRPSVVASAAPMSVMLPGGRPESEIVGGQTDHLQFARLVATALLTYDPSTDFGARNQDLLYAAAPAPYGDEARLAEDL